MEKRPNPSLMEDPINPKKRRMSTCKVQRTPKIEEVNIDPNGDLLLILTKHEKNKEVSNDPPVEDDDRKQNMESPIKKECHEKDENPRKPSIPIPGRVHVRVSSKHMTLASPIFRVMLAPNGFMEGRDLELFGRVEVPLPDDDDAALILLLRIIHNHTKEIPVSIELELLTKVALLVDKYRLQDAVEFFSKIWMNHVDHRTGSFHLNIPQWLCISLIFRNKQLFDKVAGLAVEHSDINFGINFDDLPIPDRLIEHIKHARLQVIGPVLRVLDAYAAILKNSKSGFCPIKNKEGQLCSALLCGSFMRSCARNGIELSGDGKSINVSSFQFSRYSLIQKVKRFIDYQGLCKDWGQPATIGRRRKEKGTETTTDHGLKEKVIKAVDSIKVEFDHPKLRNYTT